MSDTESDRSGAEDIDVSASAKQSMDVSASDSGASVPKEEADPVPKPDLRVKTLILPFGTDGEVLEVECDFDCYSTSQYISDFIKAMELKDPEAVNDTINFAENDAKKMFENLNKRNLERFVTLWREIAINHMKWSTEFDQYYVDVHPDDAVPKAIDDIVIPTADDFVDHEKQFRTDEALNISQDELLGNESFKTCCTYLPIETMAAYATLAEFLKIKCIMHLFCMKMFKYSEHATQIVTMPDELSPELLAADAAMAELQVIPD